MSIIKKGMRKIGIGRKLDVDNNRFVLDAIWPDGTWTLLAQVGVANVEMDRDVRRWLIQVYLYDEQCRWKEKYTTLAWHAPSSVKLPFDWYPSADMIRGLNTVDADNGWPEEDLTHIITKLHHLGHLKT